MSEMDRADGAEVADQLPKKTCDWRDDATGRPCPNDAVRADFARTDSRVNDHGVHISTEVRVVWVCEDHAGIYESVPDREADVTTRYVDTETDREGRDGGGES